MKNIFLLTLIAFVMNAPRAQAFEYSPGDSDGAQAPMYSVETYSVAPSTREASKARKKPNRPAPVETREAYKCTFHKKDNSVFLEGVIAFLDDKREVHIAEVDKDLAQRVCFLHCMLGQVSDLGCDHATASSCRQSGCAENLTRLVIDMKDSKR